MTVTPPRLAIAVELDELRALMREFIDEQPCSNKHLYEWRFETFLQWLIQRQEITEIINEKTETSLHNASRPRSES